MIRRHEEVGMVQLFFFVPPEQAEAVKEACFEAGGGAYKRYDRCSWECEGQGQFRPLEGSTPFIGSRGKREKVKELKVEMFCREEDLRAILQALIKAHPYEEPAYYAVPVLTLEDLEP